MVTTPWGQHGHALRFDWGRAGAGELSSGCGVLVIVEVLSFTTSVTVVIARGVAVYPPAWQDSRAAALAARVDARLAVGRGEVIADRPWSLSPVALAAAPAPDRLVLPSPNGSNIAAASDGDVVACCLRNVTAVADWLSQRVGTADCSICAIAAGERWPDGSLRPALEDLLGAGALLSAIGRERDVRALARGGGRRGDVPGDSVGSGRGAPVRIRRRTGAAGLCGGCRDGRRHERGRGSARTDRRCLRRRLTVGSRVTGSGRRCSTSPRHGRAAPGPDRPACHSRASACSAASQPPIP